MNKIIKNYIGGLIFGFGILSIFGIGYLVAHAWLPDANGLTAEVGDKLTVAKVNSMIPASLIGSFYASSCPTGWKAADGSNGTPDLRGVFLRGINNFGGTNGTRSDGNQDPDCGSRTGGCVFGSSQTDAFQGHKVRTTFSYAGAGSSTAGVTFVTTPSSTSRDGVIITDGVNGTPRTSSETRPKNIGVIFCMKN